MSRLKCPVIFLLIYLVLAIITGMIEQSWYYDIVNSESELQPYDTDYLAAMPLITKISYYLHFNVLRFPVGTLLKYSENSLIQQIVIFSFIINSLLACAVFLFLRKIIMAFIMKP